MVRIENFNGTVLNASEMGLGKTIETLWSFQRNPQWLPALIVAPAHLKMNWQYEAHQYTNLQAVICNGMTPPRNNQFNFASHVPLTIINYDILHNWLPYLRNRGFRSAVFDECQALQNPGSIRSSAAARVCRWVQHVMMLSGTPLSNRPSELFHILNLLWPGEFPAWAEYASRYCKPRWTPWGWDFRGSDNLPELHARLIRLGMIRRKKVDVLKDLPPKNRRIVPCELYNPKEYEEASTNFLDWLRRNMVHRVRSASRAQKLTQIGYLLRLAARLKFRKPVEWANQFLEETDEKVVLMAIHGKAIDVLRRRIAHNSVVVDGSLTDLAVHEAKNRFQNDPNVRCFIGSRRAWSGLTLTAASNVGVCEFFWRPGDHAQLEARVDRIGQKSPSWIHYFCAVGTIEEKLCRILQEKQGVLSAVLDGESGDDDLNLYSMLIDELEQEL